MDASWVSALADVTVAVAALSGLSLWRREMRHKVDHDAALAALRVVFPAAAKTRVALDLARHGLQAESTVDGQEMLVEAMKDTEAASQALISLRSEVNALWAANDAVPIMYISSYVTNLSIVIRALQGGFLSHTNDDQEWVVAALKDTDPRPIERARWHLYLLEQQCTAWAEQHLQRYKKPWYAAEERPERKGVNVLFGPVCDVLDDRLRAWPMGARAVWGPQTRVDSDTHA